MFSQIVPLTPLSFLRRSADVFSGDVAVVDTGGELISYAEFGARAAQLADALRAAGVNPGDRVAVLASNTSDLLSAHFGVPGAGAVLVALNTRLGPSEYTYILNHSGARILLVDSALAPAIAAVRDSVSSALQLVELGDGSALSDAMPYAAWVAQASTGPPKPGLDRDSSVLQTRTSRSPSTTPVGRRAGRKASCTPTAGRISTLSALRSASA
jgi:fatty-acyl-CoA synthase